MDWAAIIRTPSETARAHHRFRLRGPVVRFSGTTGGDADRWFVSSASPGNYPPLSAFLRGLDEVGFVEGRDFAIEYRWAHGRRERLPALIDDLIRRKVSVIAATDTPAAMAAKAANVAIPTVFTMCGDPVQLGLVSSIARPNGNLTGARQFDIEVAPKRLELLREMFPAATNVGLLVNPPHALANPISPEISEAAAALGLKLRVLRASDTLDLATTFKILNSNESCARNRLPLSLLK